MTEYVVIDTECTFKKYNKKELKNLCLPANSPFLKRNSLVALGCRYSYDGSYSSFYTEGDQPEDTFQEGTMIVGHNIKFDIVWLMTRNPEFRDAFMSGHYTVFDTQHAHYLLSGQRDKFPSLNEAAERYGLGVKDDKVKELWDSGLDTDEIDKDILMPYLKRDVELAHEVFKYQLAELEERDLTRVMAQDMNAIRALCAIEYNGMPVRVDKLLEAHDALDKDIDKLTQEVRDVVMGREVILNRATHGDATLLQEHTLGEGVLCGEAFEDLPPMSNKFLSWWYNGGIYEVKRKEDHGIKYKTGARKGEPKLVTVTYELYIEKAFGLVPETSFDSAAMDAKAKKGDKLAGLITKLRKKDKELNTYILPFLRTQAESTDGRLHPTYNQSATSTGRLSSSHPNGQNLGGEYVKGCIGGEGSDIIEADYSQLEMIILAALAKDDKLLHDIEHDVDLHYETGLAAGVWANAAGMTKEKRRKVKAVNFGLVYGGQTRTLAKQSGLSEAVVGKVIDAWYKRYPGVRACHDDWIEDSKTKWYPIAGKKCPKTCAQIMGYDVTTPIGREMTIESTEFYGKQSISPTKLKNYPVQSLATADIVPTALSRLFDNGYADRMIATVHDSVLFERKGDQLFSCVDVAQHMEMAGCDYLNSVGYELDIKTDSILACKLKAEVEAGETWKLEKGVIST